MRYTLLLLSLFFAGFGCATTPTSPPSVFEVGIDVRTDTQLIDPATGEDVDWAELMRRIDEADIVLLGELHDHAIGHAIQLAVVEDVLDTYKGSAVALEMLERHEQPLVDDYVEGIIKDSKRFAKLTHSTNWGGWELWYQPIIDAAIDRGGRIVAANAPKQYVTLARKEGFARIDQLPEERRRLVDYPAELSGGRYRERFWEFANHGEEEETTIDVSTIDPDDPMLPLYRSQQTWDATMAQSVLNANPTQDQKVILLVGQFHVEFDGGIVQELRYRNPDARVFVLSIQREIPEDEWQAVPPIADLMIVGD